MFPQEHLAGMSEEDFEKHKQALAAQRLEKPKRLSALSARFWSEITSQQYNFDRAEVEVGYLRTITKQDIIDFYNVSSVVRISFGGLIKV